MTAPKIVCGRCWHFREKCSSFERECFHPLNRNYDFRGNVTNIKRAEDLNIAHNCEWFEGKFEVIFKFLINILVKIFYLGNISLKEKGEK